MKFLYTAAPSLVLLTLLSGCAGTGSWSSNSGSSNAAPAPTTQLCNAQAAQSAVGQKNTAKVVEAARVKSGAMMARILAPNQAVTMEFDAQRLNLQVDATGRITAANCG